MAGGYSTSSGSSDKSGDSSCGYKDRDSSGEGAETACDYKNQILVAALRSSQRGPPGSFAMQGVLRSFCPPGLELPQFGLISFPLSPIVAEEVAKVCSPAPFGRRGATIFDPAVRNCLQLEPKDFRLTNPFWEEQVQKVANGTVKDGLGLKKRVAVIPQLYKLLLYKTGCFFSSHSDSEKTDGMFATLVIVLPSAHAGGELIMRHAGLETTFDSGSGSLDSLQFAAFYADCQHELRAVREGYRLALIYNLVTDGTVDITTPVTNKTLGHHILDAVEEWTQEGSWAKEKLVIPLTHRYSKHALSIKNLKGDDMASMDALLQAVKLQQGPKLHLWLGVLQKTSKSYVDYDSIGDTKYQPLDVVSWDQQEGVVFEKLFVEQDEILPENAMEVISACDKEKVEQTGNEGTVKKRWYHHAAIVLWPHCSHWKLVINNPQMAVKDAQTVAVLARGTASGSPERADLKLALEALSSHGRDLADTEARLLAGLIVEHGSLKIAQTFLNGASADTMASISTVTLLNHFGWAELKEAVAGALKRLCHKPGLDAALGSLLSLAAQARMGDVEMSEGEPCVRSPREGGEAIGEGQVGSGELSQAGQQLLPAPHGMIDLEESASAPVNKREEHVAAQGPGTAGGEDHEERGESGEAVAAAVASIASGLADLIAEEPREEVKKQAVYYVSKKPAIKLKSTGSIGVFLRVLEEFGVDTWRGAASLIMANTVTASVGDVPMLLSHLESGGEQEPSAAGAATGASVRTRSKEFFFAGHTLATMLVRHLTSHGLASEADRPLRESSTRLAAFVADSLRLSALFLPDAALERLIHYLLVTPTDFPLNTVLLPALRTLHASRASALQAPWFIRFAVGYRHAHELETQKPPPVQPRDWALSNSSVDCDCQSCGALSAFCKASDSSDILLTGDHLQATIRRNNLPLSAVNSSISSDFYPALRVRKRGSRGRADAEEWTAYRATLATRASMVASLCEVVDMLTDFWVNFALRFGGQSRHVH